MDRDINILNDNERIEDIAPHFFCLRPYKESPMMNHFFWDICMYLGENTNMLSFVDNYGVITPIGKEMLKYLLPYSKSKFYHCWNRLRKDKIIGQFKTGKTEKIFVNPYYVVRGTEYSKFLFDIFSCRDNPYPNKEWFEERMNNGS